MSCHELLHVNMPLRINFWRLLRWYQWQRMCLPMQEKQEIRVRSLSQEDLLEEEMATNSGILAWKNSMNKGA